jgi:hypothetical protein
MAVNAATPAATLAELARDPDVRWEMALNPQVLFEDLVSASYDRRRSWRRWLDFCLGPQR